jgi:hypothetical protein
MYKKQSDNSSIILSFIAITLSVATLYLQFFYNTFDLNVSLIDETVSADSLQLSLIYNNKGNHDAAILSSEIFLYSKNNLTRKGKRLYPIQKTSDPQILAPKKQMYVAQKVNLVFSVADLKKHGINLMDTLKVGLDVQYLRDNLLQGEVIRSCGWIIMDKANTVSDYLIQYQNISLDANEYFVSGRQSKRVEKKVVTTTETIKTIIRDTVQISVPNKKQLP